MKEITMQFLDNIKFAADCAIKGPDSIYAQEFFMLLDETFGNRGDYKEPVQAVAVSWLVGRLKDLERRADAAEREAANAKYEWGEAQANYDALKKSNAELRSKLAEAQNKVPVNLPPASEPHSSGYGCAYMVETNGGEWLEKSEVKSSIRIAGYEVQE